MKDLIHVLLLLLFSFFLSTRGHAAIEKFADKNHYLIDSLSLDELVPSERKLLDSCINVYHHTTNQVEKIEALSVLCERLNHHSWSRYQNRQQDLIKNIDYNSLEASEKARLKKELASNWAGIGHVESGLGNYKNALVYHRMSLRILSELNDKKHMASVYNMMGMVYKNQGRLLKALEIYNKALFLQVKEYDLSTINNTLNNIGKAYRLLGNMELAVKNYDKSLKVSRYLKDELGIMTTLNNIGLIHRINGNQKRAMEYYNEALLLSKKIGSKDGEIRSRIHIGALLASKGEFEKALFQYDKALKGANQINVKKVTNNIMHNIGNLYEKKQELDNALKIYRKSLLQDIDRKDTTGIIIGFILTGRVHLKTGNVDSAEYCLDKGFRLAQKFDVPAYVKMSAKALSEVFEKKGDFKVSLEMFQVYNEIKEKEEKSLAKSDIAKLESRQQLESKDQKIRLLGKEKELKRSRFQFSIVIFALSIIILVVGSVLWVRRKRTYFDEQLNTLRELRLKLEEETLDASKRITSIQVIRGGQIIDIELTCVTYFKAESKYVFLVNKESESFIIDETLSSLEKKLPNHFIRVHRSSIINENEVLEITKTYRGKVVFTMKDKDKSEISSSLSYTDKVRNLIDGFKLGAS